MSIDNLPLVSVVVPCYNHAQYVEECIESIINQTYPNIQIIVIDDGSKDSSVQKLKKLQEKYDFILECQENMGLTKTLNKALKEYVEGKYLCALASDDYWPLDKIAKQVKFMEQNPDIALVFGKCMVIKEGIISAVNLEIKEDYLCFEGVFKKNEIAALTVMLRTDAVRAVGGYIEGSIIEDIDMWLKIAYKYSIGYIPEYIGYYRKHSSNITNNMVKMFQDRLKVFVVWKGKVDPKLYNMRLNELKTIAFYTLSKDYKKEALKYFPKRIDAWFSSMFIKGVVRLLFY